MQYVGSGINARPYKEIGSLKRQNIVFFETR